MLHCVLVALYARVFEQKHSEEYSAPAYLYPSPWHVEVHVEYVMLLEAKLCEPSVRVELWLSTKQPSADQPDGKVGGAGASDGFLYRESVERPPHLTSLSPLQGTEHCEASIRLPEPPLLKVDPHCAVRCI